MSAPHKLNGVITYVEPVGQTVHTDASPEFDYLLEINLHGMCRIPGNPPVGTEVELEYRNSSSYGLWFGKVKS